MHRFSNAYPFTKNSFAVGGETPPDHENQLRPAKENMHTAELNNASAKKSPMSIKRTGAKIQAGTRNRRGHLVR